MCFLRQELGRRKKLNVVWNVLLLKTQDTHSCGVDFVVDIRTNDLEYERVEEKVCKVDDSGSVR
jgi:hypothetical protein